MSHHQEGMFPTAPVNRIAGLEAEVARLQENYTGALQDVEHLEAKVARLTEERDASRALVAKKDKALETVSRAWFGSRTPQELWEKFSDENEGDDLWGIVVEARALTEADMLERLEKDCICAGPHH